MLDDEGRPTGVEKKSFRLNIKDGRTESIDDEWSTVAQQLGIPDGTNSRRMLCDRACGGMEDNEYDADTENETSTESVDVPGCSRATLSPIEGGGVTGRGCSRATLKATTKLEDRSANGCPRATLKSTMGGKGLIESCECSLNSCVVDNECTGCSRATLNPRHGKWDSSDGSEWSWAKKRVDAADTPDEYDTECWMNGMNTCCSYLILTVVTWWQLVSSAVTNRAWGECGALQGGGTWGASMVHSREESNALTEEEQSNFGEGEVDMNEGMLNDRIQGEYDDQSLNLPQFLPGEGGQ